MTGDHDGIVARDARGAIAIDLPSLPRRVPRGDRRRHRLVTGTSGLLLFVCLFMPAIDGCNGPVVPLDTPAFWPPYLYGFVFAFAALVRTRRGLIGATIALRTLAVMVILGGFVFALFSVPLGAFQIVYGMILLSAIGWTGYSEHRLAATAIAIASTSAVWFALWAATPAALLGVKLSLASALGLLVGSMLWMREAAFGHRTARIPSALVYSPTSPRSRGTI